MTVNNENEIIKNLLDLAHAVFVALDDSEEGCGDDGRMHIIDSANFDAVCTAMDRLDELPDDQPGYTMDAPGKAKWALRHLLTVTSVQSVQSCDAPCDHNYVNGRCTKCGRIHAGE